MSTLYHYNVKVCLPDGLNASVRCSEAQVFCSLLAESSDQEPKASSHCLVLLLKKENAVHQSRGLPAGLIHHLPLWHNHYYVLYSALSHFLIHNNLTQFSALMREFKAQKLLSCIHLRGDSVQAVEPNLCFHTVPYSSKLFRTVGKHRVVIREGF